MTSDSSLAGMTLAERRKLLSMARARDLVRGSELPPIERAPRDGRVPLSFAQQRLWFLEQLGNAGSIYHISRRHRLRGELDRAALVRALDHLVARHESLRTTFAQTDGVPEQRIAPADVSRFHLTENDLLGDADAKAEFDRVAAEELHAPFDLQHGPLIRGRLVRLADDDHVLLLTMHHIISDDWSMGVLTRELGALYAAFRRGEPDPLPALDIQYADFAAWQRRWVDGNVLQQQSDFWTKTLSGAPELLELPIDHPRPPVTDHTGALVPVMLDEALTAGLKELGRRHGATLYMTVLAGWAIVLGRLAGRDDLVIGTPTAGRGRSEIEDLIGFFINTLALRVDLAGGPTVGELVERVKERTLAAQQHQDIPFEQVVELAAPARSLSHHPLFQVMLLWQNAPSGGLELSGLTPASPGGVGLGGSGSQVAAKFDLLLTLAERGGRVAGSLTYATALFERETVERHAAYLRTVLEAMVAGEHQRVERLPLLPDAERRQVVDGWNQTHSFPSDSSIPALFEGQAARTPDAKALTFDGESLTYAELNARANRLAHHLRALGVGPEVRVALCVERGIGMMVGLLGVLKAGGVYVPMDPGYPADRIEYMLADSAPAAVLTQSPLRDLVGSARVPVLLLDQPEWDEQPSTDLDRGALTPDHTAYIIYTSGSTGRPKGVLVPHRNVARLFSATDEWFGFGETDVWTLFHSVAFDFSVWEMWGALLHGGRLVIVPGETARDPEAFYRLVCDQGVTVLNQTPSAFQQFINAQVAVARRHRLRYVVFGGEALDVPMLRPWFEWNGDSSPRLVNMYGITETTVHVTYRPITGEDLDRAGASPIGERIPDLRTYLLDQAGEPVPVGVTGELYVGGAGVARGYLGRPELTAERFVADPFSGEAGARLYRSGDLGRWLADGTLEFLGRADHQVKIRGFRIELGEIEARLREHVGVRDAVVIAREDVPGEKRLVAYIVGDEWATADLLRSHVGETLPDYMVPAAFVHLDAFPLTANGKLDRKALPAPEGDAFAAREYEAPLGETEQALAEIWAEVLRVEQVGRWDDFFELGGHSLLAVQVISRVQQVLAVDLELGELFYHPVLRDLARELETKARAELPPIEPAPRDGRIPLSFSQQRLWFLEQMGGLGSMYHVSRRHRLQGELDRAALARALDAMVARHESLRTTFAQTDGVPEQRIASPDAGFALVEHDLSGEADPKAALAALMAEETHAPFDLERGPLIRGRLVRLADDDHLLLLTMHHIVSDGWSMGVLTRELSALYAAFRRGDADPLPALDVQYADYAIWQRRWVEGEVLRAQTDYWSKTLAGVPELLELPADRPRPAQVDHAGARVGMMLDEELTAALKALSRRHGTTLFMTLLAGWAAVLSRLSGQDDVVVGSPTAGRGRREIEGLIGFFVSALALRVDLSGAPTVAELLARVKERAIGAQHHQDIPFEQVVDLAVPTRSLSHAPLVQVAFSWQSAPFGALELAGVTLGSAGRSDERVTAKDDIALALGEANGRITGSITYATSLFERETVERWAGYLRRMLMEMAAGDARRVDRLPLLPPAERALLLETWNDSAAAYADAACAHELFEAHAARIPHATALETGNAHITYAELNRRANRLAHHLRALGVGPDARVAICVERGVEMVVSLLAVLKAGGAYVPLDPDYPAERLQYMLDDSRPALLITRGPLAARFADAAVPLLDLSDSAAWDRAPSDDLDRNGLRPENLAYLIYTSGSTGRPKGVMIQHRNLCNLVAAQARSFPFDEASRVLQFASFSFDGCTFEVFMALARGVALQLAEKPGVLAGDDLVRVATRGGVTHAILPPAVLAALPEGERLPTIHTLVMAADAPSTELMTRWAPGRRLLNGYGPTEATVAATNGDFQPGIAGPPPIGRPMANARVYLLDKSGEVVPRGARGELYIGGLGVGRGYWNRPALTAERFVPDPFGDQPGARMYRTGDLARWNRDGALEFAGRVDEQVKVRGFRIELGEIEARLAEYPSIREVVVIAREDGPNGDKRLVAYYVSPDGAVELEPLRAHLAERLPEHMIPAAYVRLESIPLTPNGKVDRKALPSPDDDAVARRGYEAPVGETEEMLARIWSEVLGVEKVGRRDDFFELGGHSLLAVQVISRLEVEVDLGELFTRPVLADFAEELAKAGRAELPPIEPAPRGERLPLSFAQQRLWFLEQLGNLGSTYYIPRRQRLRGALDRGALVRALDRIVARHEALRTTFAQVDGVPEQRIASPDIGFHLVEHDLVGREDGDAELARIVVEESRAPFDLERGPLVRGRLIRLAEDDHLLLLTMHHIVSDDWSMTVFTRELGALYEAFRRGDGDPLPSLPVQYADFAAWQRRWVEGNVLQEQADYWTRTLAGAPELLELPADRPRPAQANHAGAHLPIVLDEALTAGLRELGRRHGATLYMTLLAGWATVLARLSGRADVVIGSPTAGRGRREIEDLIGFFVNTLALRVDLSDAPTVAQLLERVRERTLEAQAHQDIPFEQVVDLVDPVRSLAHHPLFQVMFSWQTAAERDLELSGLEMVAPGASSRSASPPRSDAPSQATAKFDLSLALAERGERIAGTLTYATSLFDRATVERFAGYLHTALVEMVADERQSVARLSIMPLHERDQVLREWNRTGEGFEGEPFIHARFEEQARRTPDAAAIVFEGDHLSFAEVNRRANRLAHHLRSLGVGPDVRVGICAERSVEMIVGLLAVLKAGGAYVPLDPSYPADRLAYMLADSAPAVVLTQTHLRDRVGGGVPVLELDAASAWDDRPMTDPERGALAPGHLAYVIYTSGSTGRPKGVGVHHRGVVNRLDWMETVHRMGIDETVLQKTPFSFDVSVWELFWPLIAGARMVIARPEGHRDPAYLADVVGRERITTVHFVPSLLGAFLEDADVTHAATSLRRVVSSGEALSPERVARFGERLRGVDLHNLYGPTEASVDVTVWRCPTDGSASRIPIGRPVPNTRIYLLDEAGEPVPVGVAGELCIGGVQVARGYLGRPELTAERFVADAHSGEPGARLYRTGDLARWLADGTIEYLGRSDFQVKIRGFRIELGEVEARLATHPSVRDAAVLAREDAPGELRLVAYVVGETVDADALRAHLGETLPEHMVPAAYVRLDAWPLTPSGKLDRKALPAPEGGAFAAREYEAPAGEIEEALAEIWSDLLKIERVGRRDDFFKLGGHSLLAVQLVSRVREAMEVEVALGAIFRNPTLAALGDHLLELQLAHFDPEMLARLAEVVREPGTEA